jgi:hypothetical protein
MSISHALCEVKEIQKKILDIYRLDDSISTPWGCGAVGSASDWQSEGHGFESRQLHFKKCSFFRFFTPGLSTYSKEGV